MRLLVASALFGLVLANGCSDGPSGHVDVDRAFSLIADLKVTRIEPSEYTPGTPVNLTVVCDSRYAGSGVFDLVGHGGGSDVGALVEPEAAEVGVYSSRLDLPAGRTEIPLTLLMTTTLDKPALSITVMIDSLLVGNSMVTWNSPEGYEVFRADIPRGTAFLLNSGYEYVTIQRAGRAR